MSARPNWLKNSVTRKGEEGQALAAVMGLTAVMALLIVSVELSSIGQARLATITTSSEEALLAAEAGANDYQAWLAGSNNTWAYASAYCSNGVVWPISAPWSSTQCSAHPDPKNPAYVGALDQHCATDLSTTSGWSSSRARPRLVGKTRSSSTLSTPDKQHRQADLSTSS